MDRGRAILKEINSYDDEEIKKEIEALRKEQKEIKTMTSNEIKEKLLSEISGDKSLAKETIVSSSIRKLEEVASDPKKAQQMAELLSDYGSLCDAKSQIKEYVDLRHDLPRLLYKRLEGHRYINYSNRFEEYSYRYQDLDELMKIVEEFEGSFEQAKASFMEQFTEQKLSKLYFEPKDELYGSEDDMDFLQQHIDKLGADELGNLQSLVNQRNELSNKIFKTRGTKIKVDDLNSKIQEEQFKIYKKIIKWYEFQKELLGIYDKSKFFDTDCNLKKVLESYKEKVSTTEKTITKVKEDIQKAKTEIEQQKQNYESRKNEVAQQVKALGGTDIEYLPTKGVSVALSMLSNVHREAYKKEMVDKVQKEAQNQANIKEAELRGITVEQLLQMKQQKQTATMANESVAETPKEEVAQSIKR